MMNTRQICLVVTAILIGIVTANGNENGAGNIYLIDKLRASILKGYDNTARPPQHNATVVRVAVQFACIRLDEFAGTMTTNGRIAWFWTDLRLRWDETEYDDMESVALGREEIWHPEVQVLNSASFVPELKKDHGPCSGYPTGEVRCLHPITFIVHCEFKLRHWPFDTQTCHILLGSWTNLDLNLRFSAHHSDMTSMVQAFDGWPGWELLQIKRFRKEKWFTVLNRTAAQLDVAVTLRRQSPSYIVIIITPAIAIVLMTLIGFHLPLNAFEKIILNAFTIIVISFFFIFFFQRIPSMALHTPLVVLFYVGNVWLVSLSLVISVVIINLYEENSTTQPACWLNNAIDIIDWATSLKCITCTKYGPRFKLPDGQSNISTYQSEWIKIATVLNRVFFLLYCIVFSILILCCTVYNN